MNSALTKEKLAQILDQALQDVTERTAGVRPPPGEICARCTSPLTRAFPPA